MRSRLTTVLLAGALLCATALAQETIGSWELKAAPVSAALIQGGGPDWDSINVVNVPIDVNTAFSGFSLIDAGYANGQTGTTLEMTFAPGILVNQIGTDLVLFDTFSFSDYAVSTEYDGFAATVAVPFAKFSDTGEQRAYYFKGAGPYQVSVRGAPIELSDLGVPPGVAIERVRVIAVSDQVDPLGLGVPCKLACDFEAYCSFAPNSTGGSARIYALGSPKIAANNLTLRATPVPNEFYLFLYGSGTTQTPFGNGYLCVTGTITRLPPAQQASGQMAQLELDLPALGITPGELQFQCWFRDPSAGGAKFNTSEAMSVFFVP